MTWLRRYWPYAVLLLLIGLNGLALWQRQWIGDWWRLRGYQPPAAIMQLADHAAMTDEGRHLFYINHPQLENKSAFNAHCADLDEETAVLGCYHGNRRGIYLYAVEDTRLNGVREVTAAHEMLHQAYDRLSGGERKHLDGLLNAYYDSGTVDEHIRSKIESYRKQKDAVLTNEMHSIFGSEVRTLTPELETYYKRYFTDRLQVVSLSEAYQGEFIRREQLVATYDTQLASLKQQIDANKAELDRRLRALETEEAAIETAAQQQDVAAYRTAVTQYNAHVGTYNSLVTATRNFIADYNDIVAKRNDIAVEEQQLQQALDSQLAPAQQ